MRLVFVVTLCCTVFCAPSFGQTLTIGINERDIFRFKDEQDQWQGKDVELVKALFSRLDYDYQLVKMPWPRVLKSIQMGLIDMTLSAIQVPERDVYARFSKNPFRYSHYVLFINKQKRQLFEGYNGLNDLLNSDVSIGALRGAVYSDEYYAMLKNDQFFQRILFVDDDKRLPRLILMGRVDAYIESEIEGAFYLSEQPKYSNQIEPLLRITNVHNAVSPLMFSKKTVSQSVVNEFDTALLELHQSGDYQRISTQYNPLNWNPKASQ